MITGGRTEDMAFQEMISQPASGIKFIGIFGFLKNKKENRPNFKYSDSFPILADKKKISFSFTLFKKTFAALSRAEKILVGLLFLAIIASSAKLAYNFWLNHTILVPADGGTLTEGIIGSPRYINPLFSQDNDADTDLVKLIYSSLFTFDINGELKPDLVESYSISDDNKTYTIKIKNNVFWHKYDTDQILNEKGRNLNADDVLFTIRAIQNPSYNSSLRNGLSGVEAEKMDDFTVKLTLKSPYEPFLQNLTFGILPSQIWKNIDSKNTPLAIYNTKPIGSGPYVFDSLTKDSKGNIVSFTVKKNIEYYGQKPYIDKIVLNFYGDQDSLLAALSNGTIDATGYLSDEKSNSVTKPDLKKYDLEIPGYFAVFFNQEKNKALTEKNVRLAFNYLTDKNEIVNTVNTALKNNGGKTDTPIPPSSKYYNTQTKNYDFNIDYANSILTNSGWIPGEDGIRGKEFKKEPVPPPPGTKTKPKIETENIPLEIALATSDSPELQKTAEILKTQWEKGGARVNLNILKSNSAEIDSAIKNRDYDALLFGEIIKVDPEPFIFWHSSEIKAPGLNLALYSNKDVDKMLEELRQTFDQDKKKELLASFQEQVVDDVPAVFLFNQYSSYWAKSTLEGMETKLRVLPADRFASVNTWSLMKKRVWDGKLKFLNL